MEVVRWIIEKAREFKKTFISDLLTIPKPLTVDHNKLWKILKEMGNSAPSPLPSDRVVTLADEHAVTSPS